MDSLKPLLYRVLKEKYIVFRYETWLLNYACPIARTTPPYSVCPYVTAWFPLTIFFKFLFWEFKKKICPNISLLITMDPNKTIHMKSYIHLP